MCWMWWKLDNNNRTRWNINPITQLTIDGIITTTMATMELINIQTNGVEVIGTVAITHKIWT